MAKKSSKDPVVELMGQIQQQLAVLDRKLDQFMTKSLKELAEALAASKPAQVVHVPAPSASPRPNNHSSRPMYAVVCFDCGKDTEIPFKPSGDRPVYCKECFAKRKGQTAKAVESKPQGFSIAPAAPVASKPEATPQSKKKPAAAKKTTAKKKTATKKSAKRK